MSNTTNRPAAICSRCQKLGIQAAGVDDAELAPEPRPRRGEGRLHRLADSVASRPMPSGARGAVTNLRADLSVRVRGSRAAAEQLDQADTTS